MCIKVPCGYSSQTLTKTIAYCELVVNVFSILICMVLAIILEANAPLIQEMIDKQASNNQDIIMFLTLPHAVQTLFILWIIFNFVAGVILGSLLLQGAQQRHLGKVRLWFLFTIAGYILWLPVFIIWTVYSFNPVNVVFTNFMSYVFAGTALSIVYSFMEELRVENICHRPGFKEHRIAFHRINV